MILHGILYRTETAPGTEWNQAREVATLAIHDLIHRHLFKLTGLGLGVQRLLPRALLGHEIIRVVRQDVLAEPELLPANGVQLVRTLHVPESQASASAASTTFMKHLEKCE